MERSNIIRASFITKSEKRLQFLIQKLVEAFGKENVNWLVPKYVPKSQIFVLDMDIRIPDVLLRYDFKEAKTSSGGTE